MNSLDILILVVLLALGVLGYAQGFIIGAASLFGLALGGLVGTRVTHSLLERGASNVAAASWAPLLGLVVGLLITVIGAMAMQDLGSELRARMHAREHGAIDHALGGVLLVVVGLLFTWFTAAASVGVPDLRSVRPLIVESAVIKRLNSTLPDAGPLLGAINSYDPFPAFDGGRINIDAPDPQLPGDPEVAAAARSVVRVLGTACGYRVTGSGWVAAPGYVMTNAHVVAGEEDTAVQVGGQGDPLDADVVAFDEVNDLAILRVADLELAPLLPRATVRRGTAAAVLGYPENRGLTATAARFDDEREVRGKDIYGARASLRAVTSFRGVVRHGNSGGPLVDADGHVLSTVFASTVGERVRGGYGIPNDVATAALKEAREVPRGYGVRTGPCIA